MPAFTFEKISPPSRGPATPPPATSIPSSQPEKPRGMIVQVLGRFVEARVQRGDSVAHGTLTRRSEPSGK